MTDHIQKLSSKCWNERKEALDQIDARLRSVKCPSTEAFELVNAVIKVLSTDTHMLLVATSANIITRTAGAMKSDFSPMAKCTLAACLSGFRSNKPAVVTSLRAAAFATLNSLNLDSVVEAVLNSVGGKASNPSVIAESVGFLARALQHFHVTTQQPGLPTRRTLFMRILAPMVPLMEARTDYVRYAAYSAVAAARIFLADEQAYSQLTFESVDASKKTRIDSALIKLQSETAAPVKRPPEFTESKVVGKPASKREQEVPQELSQPQGAKRPKTASACHASTKILPSNATAATATCDPFVSEIHLSEDDLKRQLQTHSISDTLFCQLKSSNWRDRLTSIENIRSCLCAAPLQSPGAAQSFVNYLLQPPGLKDTNVNVKCRLLETIAFILNTSKQRFVSASIFETLITSIGGMMGGIKELSSCEACLSGLECSTSSVAVGEAVLRFASTIKVPKTVEHLINWLAHSMDRSGFCLNRVLTVSHLKAGLENISESVRQAYVKLAGAVYTGLAFDMAFRNDLEASCRPSIAAHLKAEFDGRRDNHHKEDDFFDPLFPSKGRMTTNLNSPSEALLHSIRMHEDNPGGESFDVEGDAQSPLGLSSTFCAISVPLLMADFKAKRTRIQQMASASVRPTRDRLQTAFVAAGMHPNLCRLLGSWNDDPGKTTALGLLIHLLQQQPTTLTAVPTTDPLSDALANSDLILLWISEACLSNDSLNEQIVTMAVDYLEAFIARLADAKLTLTPEELGILLPWPLLSANLLGRYFGQSHERRNRLMGLLLGLCGVLPANLIYGAVMEALSALVEPHVIVELLLLIKLLITRFPSLPNPSVADIKAIAQHIGSANREVHGAALDCLKAARGVYTTEQISAMAGKLTERDRNFLEGALKNDLSISTCGTPLRPRTPQMEGGGGAANASYTNNPSILASVSRSHRTQRSRLMPMPEDDENLLLEARQWMLDVLNEDDRLREARMVSFLVSKLVTEPLDATETSDVEIVNSALLALSHLHFLHCTTSTRDLLLAEASRLVNSLGLQMTYLAVGNVPAFNYSSDEAAILIRSTAGLTLSIFRAAFLTRDLEADSLSQLLAGLLRLYSTFDLICKGSAAVPSVGESLLSLVLDKGVAEPLRDDLLYTLQCIHDSLTASNTLSTYIKALANLMNSDWGGYIGPSRCFCRCLLISCNLHWHMLDLAVNTMIRSEETKTSLDEVIDFLGCLYPFEPPKMSDSPDLHNAFGPGLQIAGFGWSRLRSLNSSRC